MEKNMGNKMETGVIYYDGLYRDYEYCDTRLSAWGDASIRSGKYARWSGR